MFMISQWPFVLAEPAWIVGLAAVPLLVWWYRLGLVDFHRGQRLLSLAGRSAILVLLVLALARLTWLTPSQEPFVVFLLDRSQSVGTAAQQTAERFVDQALGFQGANACSYLEFGASPGQVTQERPKRVQTMREDVNSLGTDIAAAIEVAAGAVPPGLSPHLVLLSDGNETNGNAVKAIQRAGVAVSTVPLPAPEEAQMQVSEVRIDPPQVRAGEGFTVEVVINSNHEDEGFLKLFMNGRLVPEVREKRRKIHKGENVIPIAIAPVAHLQKAVISAELEGFDNKRPDLNSARALVYCAEKPRVLIVDSDPKQIRHLVDALREQEIDVDDPLPQEGVPSTLAELQNYDLLVLSNVPATAMSQKQMALIRTYVRDLGGGLLMLGGNQSFGLGGYSKSVLEDLLPVHCDLKRDKEKPTLAMVLVIDRSTSMQGQKIEAAKEAARAAVELLGPNDKIGVIAFDSVPEWICDLRPCSDKEYIRNRISRIQAVGGTQMVPALLAAQEELVRLGSSAKLKHVILLTDGDDNIAPGGELSDLASRMSTSRLTLSTVGVGSDVRREELEQMARSGGGRCYLVDDPSSIPQIFAKETMEAAKDAIIEEAFAPIQRRQTPVLAGLDWESMPQLHGYVTTREKATSETILVTQRSDPLLSWWRTGLGMCVAFTADAKTKWSDDWIANWPGGYSKFWAQVVRHAMRKNEAKGVEVQLRRQGRKTAILVDAIDERGAFLDEVDTDVTVLSPHDEARTVALRQTAPGRWATELDTADPGEYYFLITQSKDGRSRFQQTRGLIVGYPDELRMLPTNERLLRTLAEESGGIFQVTPEQVFRTNGPAVSRAVPLWPYLVLVAMVLFIFDVALRRIDFAPLFAAVRWEPTAREELVSHDSNRLTG